MSATDERGVLAISAEDSPNPGLVGRALEGDFTAYERLYHRHVGRIYAICLRMTGDPANAEDMTQQAFIRGWERLASLRSESEFAAWLRRIAVNVVLSERRARSRRHEQGVEDVESISIRPQTGPTRVGPIDLDRAIAALPERARAVFVLHDVEGYRHGEIATMLGIAEGTSKTQLHRARRLLREALKR